jgi:hypothetical protein
MTDPLDHRQSPLRLSLYTVAQLDIYEYFGQQ